MSATSCANEDVCTVCGEQYSIPNEAPRGYCSLECVDREKGQKILNLLKHDHRYCHGCFIQLKEIERPTDEQLRHVEGQHSADAIIGFQYGTKHAETGQKTIVAKDNRKEVVGTGIVCSNCGTTDHRDSFQRDLEPKKAAKRLRKRVKETKNEGQHSYTFDGEAFVEAWNENAGDWELALGRALD